MIDINALKQDKRPQSSTIVHALIDRLEAVEKERDSLRADKATLQQMAYSLKDRLEVAGKSDAESLAMYRKARDERDALRAKMAEMERQEPVAEWTENRFHHYPQLDWAAGYKAVIGAKLYALPGAQGEEK